MNEDLEPSSSIVESVLTTASESSIDRNNLRKNAQIATDYHHSLTPSEAFKDYKEAIWWASVMSLTIVMEGYDTSLIGNLFGFPSFQKKYGVEISPGVFELQSHWQIALGVSPSVGVIIGIFVNGYLIETFGHRRITMFCLILMQLFISITFFAPNVETLFLGQLLCGLPWGLFAIIGPTYSSEVIPLALRGYMTSYTQFCWSLGQILSAIILKLYVNNETQWSYRIPFALQWIFPLPLFILTYLAPESPWWLVRHNREEEAIKSVRRLSSSSVSHMAPPMVSMIIHTHENEISQHKKEGTEWEKYMKAFTGTNFRRTVVTSLAFSGQLLCGLPFAFSPSYFFREAGINPKKTYDLSLINATIALAGSIAAWYPITRFGRRDIYLVGLAILCTCLLFIGVAQPFVYEFHELIWVQCGLIIAWMTTYSLSLGPVTYCIISEISASSLRSTTVSIARGYFSLNQFIANAIEPILINPTSLNLRGYTALFWFTTCFIIFIWAFFELPETKDRTFDDIDFLFKQETPARKFSTTETTRLVDLD